MAWMLRSGHGTSFKEGLAPEHQALTHGGCPMWTPLYATPPDHREVMRQALEDICGAKLCEMNSMSSRQEMLRLMTRAADALRAALGEGDE
jgi:hypothetical protein